MSARATSHNKGSAEIFWPLAASVLLSIVALYLGTWLEILPKHIWQNILGFKGSSKNSKRESDQAAKLKRRQVCKMYVGMYVCMYVCMYVQDICIYVHTSTHSLHTHIHTQIHTKTHTHTQTHWGERYDY